MMEDFHILEMTAQFFCGNGMWQHAVVKDRGDPAAFDGRENLHRTPRLRSKSRCDTSWLLCSGVQ